MATIVGKDSVCLQRTVPNSR